MIACLRWSTTGMVDRSLLPWLSMRLQERSNRASDLGLLSVKALLKLLFIYFFLYQREWWCGSHRDSAWER